MEHWQFFLILCAIYASHDVWPWLRGVLCIIFLIAGIAAMPAGI